MRCTNMRALMAEKFENSGLADERAAHDRIAALPLSELECPSGRLLRLLSGARIETVGQLLRATDDELLAMPGIGAKTVEEVGDLRAQLGLGARE
jgi:DNA-directed RNA polymerase alpha subunit